MSARCYNDRHSRGEALQNDLGEYYPSIGRARAKVPQTLTVHRGTVCTVFDKPWFSQAPVESPEDWRESASSLEAARKSVGYEAALPAGVPLTFFVASCWEPGGQA